MTLLKLKQLAQDNASANNVIRFNNSTGLWEPDVEYISTPTMQDKSLVPNATSGDGQDTGLTISKAPDGYWVGVRVNGILYEVGDGYSGADGYFSGDGGVSARSLTSVAADDAFYWNGDVAGFDLTTADTIDFVYDISASGGLSLIEKKSIITNTTSVTFSGLNGEIEETYYLSFRFIGDGNISLRPNGVSTNLSSAYLIWGSGHSVGSDNSDINIASVATGWTSMGFGIFYAKKITGSTNFYRYYVGRQNISKYTAIASTGGWAIAGRWKENSTSVTSLQITSDVANGIGVGSEISLYKLAQS